MWVNVVDDGGEGVGGKAKEEKQFKAQFAQVERVVFGKDPILPGDAQVM